VSSLHLALPLASFLVGRLVGSRLITSTPKMEIALFSETLASIGQSTDRFNPKEHNQNDSKMHNRKIEKHMGITGKEMLEASA
jgi:hypothetical protein